MDRGCERAPSYRSAWDQRAIIALGRSLGLPIVAEGIETDEQLGILRRMGCSLGQGFLLGRPAAADEMTDILRAWQPYQRSA